MAEITSFPAPSEPEWIVGPFEENRVIIEGRAIPRLTAHRSADGATITLVVDRRFAVDLPAEHGRQVAWLVANALAVGEGYPWLGATARERPFAPLCGEITEGL